MKVLRRPLIVFIIILVVTSVLPFAIPINEGGIDSTQLATNPDGAFLTAQDVRIYYEDVGDRDAPPLVLIHGLFGSTMTWRYNVDALLEAGYRVIMFDRPGFGLSDKTAAFNYAISNQADLTAALLDALDIESAVIVGHSAGGNVAASFALRHPDRVDRLVLVDAAVAFGGPPAFVGSLVTLPPVWRWGRVVLQAYFTRENVEATLRGFQADPSFLTEADYDAYWRTFQTPGWDVALLAITRDLGADALDDAALSRITAQTLLIWGAEDTLTPPAQAERLAALLPNARLVVIPNAGHQPFEEDPQGFNQALIAFLSE
ncbi:MAG: alpha/beta hydrolase [Aggregatilineales bacterium]